jgi:50S ribosomal subunit-associated GTPase HflX
MVGNKSDLLCSAITEDVIKQKVAEYRAVGCVLTSAKTGDGVTEAFPLLGESISSKNCSADLQNE